MSERIRDGLKKDDGEIKALATYLPPPSVEEGGRAMVIDIGGTNIRAAIIVSLLRVKSQLRKVRQLLPFSRTGRKPRDFFECQADLSLSLSPPPGLPIGYCFSYPTSATPDRDGILIRWNKQLNVPDVVGKKVGKLLLAAFQERGYQSPRIAILNDTVASLLGANLNSTLWGSSAILSV